MSIVSKFKQHFHATGSPQPARSIAHRVISAFWGRITDIPLRPCWDELGPLEVTPQQGDLLNSIGKLLAEQVPLLANFVVGQIYTAVLPKDYRAMLGIYFTPPTLVSHLLDQVERVGLTWSSVKALDPACGTGAFLVPLALRKIQAMGSATREDIRRVLSETIKGYEIDAFSGWVSQVFLDVVMLPFMDSPADRLPDMVEIKNTLGIANPGQFDLIVGNPPFSRTTLNAELRRYFARSLFGHANLYALFTDQALHFLAPGGVVAYVTPTSFLAGQYFKNLRALLSAKAPPRIIDIISSRSGVFDDVLQETLIAVYRAGDASVHCRTNHLKIEDDGRVNVTETGCFRLPTEQTSPWIIPRSPDDLILIKGMAGMCHRLVDYGYTICTGQLVWNRHKGQLREEKGAQHYPLIWAESITSNGRFRFKATKRNHIPYFKVLPSQQHLLHQTPCVLLQRTTSKEQHRRILAAELPAEFIERHGAVVVENHINIVKPNTDSSFHPSVIAALLNSRVVDKVFRCISGSVAVSAYELNAVPLPAPRHMEKLQKMVAGGEKQNRIDSFLEEVYLEGVTATV